MQNSTIEKYRKALVDIYSMIRNGHKIHFPTFTQKHHIGCNFRSQLIRGKFIEETGEKEIYRWKWCNGNPDFLSIAKEYVSFQNNNSRSYYKSKNKPTLIVPGKVSENLSQQLAIELKSTSQAESIPITETIGLTSQLSSIIVSNEFDIRFSKLEGRVLVLLLQEMNENPEYILYKHFIERISTKLFDQVF
jgi:hypothetical protein